MHVQSVPRRILRLFIPGLVGVVLISGSAVSTARSEAGADQLIVRLQERPGAFPDGQVNAATVAGVSPEARFAAIGQALGVEGLTVERRLDDNLIVLRFTGSADPAQQAKMAELLSSHPDVRHAEPDGRVFPAFVPTDPGLSLQWYLYEAYGIQAYGAWDLQRGSTGIRIALLDTGILEHQDLDPSRVQAGYDFVDDDADPTDPGTFAAADECGLGEPAVDSSWHGLHLAGVTTAATDNNIGVAGINHVSSLVPVRVLGKCGGLYSDIIAGIRWAAGLQVSGVPANPSPARVISLSFSAPQSCTPEVQLAINDATAAGAIVVAAAGNEYGGDVANVLPASCDNVIAVAATDRSGAVAAFSNLGARVALGAPGIQIYSLFNAGATLPGADAYAYSTGTSVATAQVSAAISLLLSAQPALTLGNVRQILQQTAQPYAGGCPSSLGCGAGILDMHAALAMAASATPGDPPAAASPSGTGGGGGGCALSKGAETDAGWLVLVVLLAGLRMRSHSGRV